MLPVLFKTTNVTCQQQEAHLEYWYQHAYEDTLFNNSHMLLWEQNDAYANFSHHTNPISLTTNDN